MDCVYMFRDGFYTGFNTRLSDHNLTSTGHSRIKYGMSCLECLERAEFWACDNLFIEQFQPSVRLQPSPYSFAFRMFTFSSPVKAIQRAMVIHSQHWRSNLSTRWTGDYCLELGSSDLVQLQLLCKSWLKFWGRSRFQNSDTWKVQGEDILFGSSKHGTTNCIINNTERLMNKKHKQEYYDEEMVWRNRMGRFMSRAFAVSQSRNWRSCKRRTRVHGIHLLPG